MSNYYCLVTGLPDLALEDGNLSFTVADFKADLYPELTAADRKVIDLFFLQYDNANLLVLLRQGRDAAWDEKGNYTPEQLSALIEAVREDEKPDTSYPAYLSTFVQLYLAHKEDDKFFAEDRLASLYYAYAMQSRNSFAREWFGFNLNLNNILAALTARKFKLGVQDYIVGEGEVADALRTSGARDFGLAPVLDELDTILRIGETDDLVEKERRIDQLKWDWMENATFFNYFSVEKLFVFLVKLQLIERWINLDKEKGREMFRQIIGNLKEEVEVPEEFKKK